MDLLSMEICTLEGGHVDFAYFFQSRDNFNKSKKIVCYLFSIAGLFKRFNKSFWIFIYSGKYGPCTITHMLTQ